MLCEINGYTWFKIFGHVYLFMVTKIDARVLRFVQSLGPVHFWERGRHCFLWRIGGLNDIQSSRKARQKEAGGACAFLLQLRIQPSLLTKPGWDSFIKQVQFDQTMTTLGKYFALWKCCQCLKKLHLDKNRWVCWQVLHKCRRRMGVTFLNYLHYDWWRTRSKAT